MGVLSAHELNGLLKYKYKGGDTSYLYAHVLSPLAQLGVDYTPEWVAPNLITITGLFFCVSALILTLVINPDLSIDGPRWLHLYFGISLFIYQTLDNMDGKQARKTGSSSPLGMLFDHGCDAINAGVCILPFASTLGVGKSMQLLLIALNGFLPFYTTTWEEYYREEMVLGVVNGPSEGLTIVIGISITSYIFGPQWWQTPMDFPLPVFGVIKPADIVTYGVTFMCLLTVASQIATSCVCAFKKNRGFLHPFKTLLPFLVFITSSWIYCSNSKIALQKYADVTILLMTSIFFEIATHLMIMHICHTPLKPLQRHIVLIIVLLAVNISLSDGVLVNETLALIVGTLIATLWSFGRFISICLECADKLNIYIFSIKSKSKKVE